MIKLNIGAGRTRIRGFQNVDLSHKADVCVDLDNGDMLPWPDSSADLVFSSGTLEHFYDYLGVLEEIHRVMKHGAPLLVSVPYVTLTEYNLVNPYHHQNFNEFSFDFFDPDKLKGSAMEENPILFKKVMHRFHYMEEFAAATLKEKEWSRRHLFNVVSRIDFGVLAIKDLATPLPAVTPEELLVKFDECANSREPYDT